MLTEQPHSGSIKATYLASTYDVDLEKTQLVRTSRSPSRGLRQLTLYPLFSLTRVEKCSIGRSEKTTLP